MGKDKCVLPVVANEINEDFNILVYCNVYSLASAIPPDVTANVASFSGRSGL